MTENKKYPTIGVGGIVFKDDKVLLIQRGTPPKVGSWSIPGGRQEWGETIEQTLVREVKEETGITMSVGGFIDVINYHIDQHPNHVPEGFHYTLLDYWGEWIEGNLIAEKGEIMDVRWVSLDDLGDYKLWSETIRIINKAFEMRKRKSNDR